MRSLAHKLVPMQDTREGEYKLNNDTRRVTEFARGIINDYGTYTDAGFNLHLRDIPFYIQKLFLVIFTDRDHFYDCDDGYVRAAIARHESAIQSVINRNVESVYREICESNNDYLDKYKHESLDEPYSNERISCVGFSCDEDDWLTETYGWEGC